MPNDIQGNRGFESVLYGVGSGLRVQGVGFMVQGLECPGSGFGGLGVCRMASSLPSTYSRSDSSFRLNPSSPAIAFACFVVCRFIPRHQTNPQLETNSTGSEASIYSRIFETHLLPVLGLSLYPHPSLTILTLPRPRGFRGL